MTQTTQTKRTRIVTNNYNIYMQRLTLGPIDFTTLQTSRQVEFKNWEDLKDLEDSYEWLSKCVFSKNGILRYLDLDWGPLHVSCFSQMKLKTSFFHAWEMNNAPSTYQI